MHKALVVPEILDLIMSHVDDANALAAVARVSRSFNPPAIRWLWYDVEGSALLSLCNNLLSQRDEGGSLIPVQERLTRFHSYASLIRELTIDFTDSLDDESTDEDSDEDSESESDESEGKTSPLFGVLQRTVLLVPTTYLLPNLKKLDVSGLDSATLEAVPRFLCPTLEHVEFTVGDDIESLEMDEYESALSHVLDRLRMCRSLRYFEVDGIFELPPAAIYHLVHDCQLLEDITVEPGVLQPTVFKALATHPSLKRLSLSSPLRSPLSCDGWDTTRMKTPFASLESLSITCSYEVAISALQFIPTSLREISVDVSPFPRRTGTISEKQVVELTSAFVCHSPTLRKLHFGINVGTSTPNRRFEFMSMTGILKCRQLQELSFELNSLTRLNLQDRHIASLAKALPCLTTLNVTWNTFAIGGLFKPESLTFKSLGHLALHCKDLRSICFTSLSTRSLTPLALVEPRDDVVTLKLSDEDSKLACPEVLAACLHSIWPNIRLKLSVCSTHFHSWNTMRKVLIGIQLSQKMRSSDRSASSLRRQLARRMSIEEVILED